MSEDKVISKNQKITEINAEGKKYCRNERNNIYVKLIKLNNFFYANL